MESIFTPFSHTLQYALGWMVIHSLWHAMLIALLTGILMLVLRKKSAQVRYVLGNCALLLLLVSAIATFTYYYQTESKAKQTILSGTGLLNANGMRNATVLQSAQGKSPVLNTTLSTAADLKNTQPIVENLPVVNENMAVFKDYFNKNIPLILTIWVLGMALFLLKIMGSISYIYIIRNRHNFPVDDYWFDKLNFLKTRLKIHKSIDLLESALVRSPVVIGHLKPLILFPIGVINRLSPKDVEAILAHELAHISRHDYIFNILQNLVEAIFYYHPAVWWLSAQVRTERESACDEIAIKLTGDSIHYAKTLVTVQEMAYFPLSTALAFAGQPRKSQFLLRIQRILKQNQNPNIMEKLIATLLIISSLVVLTVAQNNRWGQNINNTQSNINISEDSFFQWGDAPLSTTGFWNAKIIGDEVKVTFNHDVEKGNWTSTRRFKKSEFSAMPTTESDFQITRDAGVMKFKGKFEGNEGYGKFNFVENADFKTHLSSYDIHNVKEELMLHLFMSDINKSYLEYLKKSGYASISKSNLEGLAIHGLTRDNLESYITTFKKGTNSNLTLNKIVELKIHGVNADYRKALNEAGFVDVPLEQIMEAKIHGIKAEYMKDMANTGQKFSLQELIEMKIHGVNAEFINKIAKGKKDLTPDEIVEAKIHGIDKIDVEKLKKAGVEPSNEELKKFAIHGVDADYIEQMNKAGFGKLATEELLNAKIHGVTAETAKAFGSIGYPNLKFDKVLEFKIHGITPDYVKAMAAAGYKDLSPNKIVEFKIHGVSADYIKSMANIGYKDVSAGKLVEMKIHGVTADFVKGFTDIGFKEISVNDAIKLKIHGITPQYIKGMQEKGYKNLDLNEYIRLRIHGFGQSTGGTRSMKMPDFNFEIQPHLAAHIAVRIQPKISVHIDEKAIEQQVINLKGCINANDF